jgi:hypothetical protein
MLKYPLKRAGRALAFALALAATPACATMNLDNPVAIAQTADQKAYALLASYAAVLETAGALVRDPALPVETRRALIRAEAVATPAAGALRAAYVAYLRARAEYAAKPAASEDAAASMAVAAVRLEAAIEAATAPVGAMSALLNETNAINDGEITR